MILILKLFILNFYNLKLIIVFIIKVVNFTAKLRLHKVLEQPEACFGGWLPLSAKLGGEPDSSLGEIRVEVRLLYGEEAGHVKEHHLGREMSKVERWWYGDEGVEKYYDIGEKLGAGFNTQLPTKAPLVSPTSQVREKEEHLAFFNNLKDIKIFPTIPIC